jgi:hypothetical protein
MTMLKRSFPTCSVAVLALACGCQGVVSTGPNQLQSRIVHALPRGGDSVATIRTLPNAACFLRSADGSNPDQQLRVFADDEGIARVHLKHVDTSVSEGELKLDCSDDAGNTVAHTLAIVVDDKAIAHEAAPFSFVGKPRLPVLTEDPLSLSDEEIRARHYPPRPDAAKNPAAYADWRDLVSSAPTLITAHMVNNPSTSHGPSVANANDGSNNWSGYVITSPGNTPVYSFVYGEWYVPQVYAEGGFSNSHHSSEWVGIDGWGTPDVVQDGTEQNTVTFFWVQTSNYHAWTEWFPYSSKAVSNFPVDPNDYIKAWTWAGDASGRFSANATVGWFYLCNTTKNACTESSTNIPPGITFNGHQAEWVMERPSVNGSLSTLAQYQSPTNITHAVAQDIAGAPHWYQGDLSNTSWNITMFNGNTVLSTVKPVNSSTMAFAWHAHQ